jgi:hypothetical protein
MKSFISVLLMTMGALFPAGAYARVIPEVRDFFLEQSNLIGQSIAAHEAELSTSPSGFRLSTIGLDIRGLVGFDAANSVNIQLIPDIELQFEREPEPRP